MVGRLPPEERLRPSHQNDREGYMHQIQFRLPSDDCDQTVQEMRRWLKTHGCEPVDFSCHDLGHHITVVVVEFENERQRCAFGEQFAESDGD